MGVTYNIINYTSLIINCFFLLISKNRYNLLKLLKFLFGLLQERMCYTTKYQEPIAINGRTYTSSPGFLSR